MDSRKDTMLVEKTEYSSDSGKVAKSADWMDDSME